MNFKIDKDVIILKSCIFIAVLIFICGVFFQQQFEAGTGYLMNFISNKMSWFYNLLMIMFFIFCIWMFFGKFRNIKLGDDDSKPEFSNISWFCMLFSAGVGIGLIFWGIAEPLTHYLKPSGIEGGTEAAKIFAFKKVFLHWGISAWSCYCFLALALAYMHFRRKKPLLVSSLLIPLIGEERATGLIGKVIDIFTIFATISGIITSLGMGTLQINSGLNYLFNIPETRTVQFTIIAVITVLFLLSACTGINKGIKCLSNLNMFFAVVLLFFTMIIGSFGDMVKNLLQGAFHYGAALITENNNIFAKGDWYSKWTLFYWGWWIAWAPFVAIFIAKVSKGRTIKEFIMGVLCIPTGFSMIWFTVFGTIGINAPTNIATKAINTVETTFFVIFKEYPMGTAICLLAVLLLFSFFITSADSATYVLAMIASNGKNPKNSVKIVLGIIQSALTIVLLFAGGLTMVQNASILMALPFGIIMLLVLFSLVKELYSAEEVYEGNVVIKNN